MNEWLLLQQYVGGGRVWLQVAFLVCLFGVIVFKPECIKNLSLFRKSYLLFAFSIIVPGLFAFFAGPLATARGGFRPGTQLDTTVQVISASGPVLFGLSIICALGALVPRFIPPPTTSHTIESPGSAPPPSD